MEIKYNNTHTAWSAPHFYSDAWGHIFIFIRRAPETRHSLGRERKTKRKFNQMRLLGILLKNAVARKDFLCPLPLAARATQSTSWKRETCVCRCFASTIDSLYLRLLEVFLNSVQISKIKNARTELQVEGKLEPAMLCRQTWHQQVHLQPAESLIFMPLNDIFSWNPSSFCVRQNTKKTTFSWLWFLMNQQILHGVLCKLAKECGMISKGTQFYLKNNDIFYSKISFLLILRTGWFYSSQCLALWR